jgi:centrosomal protein CEP104
MPALPFRVVESGGCAKGFPASSLHDSTPHAPGWVSAPFPHYPQELTLAFTGVVGLSAVMLKCHKSFVPAVVNVSVAGAAQPDRFRQVGFVKFVSGGAPAGGSVFVADLQTLTLDAEAAYLRLSIPAPYVHSQNFCNQVGLVSVALEGTIHLDKSTAALKAGQQGLDFQLLLQGIDIEEDFVHSEAKAAGLETAAGRMIRDVRRLKADYQAREEYDEAQRLSVLERKMADAGARTLELEAQKRAAVDQEDYDTAKQLKLELDELQRFIQACMQEARKRQVRRHDNPEEDTAAAQKRIQILESEKAEAVKIENYAAAQTLKTEIEKLRSKIAAREPLPPPRGYSQVNSLEGANERDAELQPERLFAS